MSASAPTPEEDARALGAKSTEPEGTGPTKVGSSFDFDGAEPDRAQDAALPVELTAADGTGLQLVSLKAKVVVEAPLAFTELRLRFRNPEPRVREGRFRITLPPGASVSRLAMKIGDRWQEGEVVERQAARRAYEDFLHRKQDPALLEKSAGNAFSARVFPIPAQSDKELILSYSHEIPAAADPYVLPLRGLPRLGELDVDVQVGVQKSKPAASSLGGTVLVHERVHVAKKAWAPDDDFVLPLTGPRQRPVLRHRNLAVARVTPVVAGEASPIHGWMILIDRSASRALGFETQLHRVKSLVEGLARARGPQVPLVVAAFDHAVEPIFDGPAGDFGRESIERLRSSGAMGASSVSAALDWARVRLERSDGGLPRLLLVTDGVCTAGETEVDALRAKVVGLSQVGLRRMDVLALGGIRDLEAMRAWTTAELPERGVVVDGEGSLEEVGRRLSSTTHSAMSVQVEGARWVWPQSLDGMQPGDQVLVYADLPEDQPLRIRIDGRSIPVGEATAVPRPLLERAWVRARIARLQHQRDTLATEDPDLQSALQNQIVQISTRHRVVSDLTALLVLETEADYRRFGIDRTALGDILTVGPSGMKILSRTGKSAWVEAAPGRRPRPDDLRGEPLASERDAALETSDEAPDPDTVVAESGADDEGPADARSGAATSAGIGGLAVRGEGRGGGGRAEGDGGGFGATPQGELQAEPAPSSASNEAMDARSARPHRRRARAPSPQPRSPAQVRLSQTVEAEEEAPSLGARQVAKKKAAPALTGELAKIDARLKRGQVKAALASARDWARSEPGNVLAWVGLGEAAEAAKDHELAMRAYGSIIDLFPSRADLRRHAGQRLERLQAAAALDLAIDTYRQARAQRPDHPASHRLLAFALLRAGRPEEAFEVLQEGADRTYPSGRFLGAPRIFGEDLGLIAAAWKKAHPEASETIAARMAELGVPTATEPSVRFVLYWETDANDVDFHIHDGRGGHAYYSQPRLPSGGELYADVTTGYGPECFMIPGPSKTRAYPYRLEAHYYRRGPMGYGMGLLQILEHDGAGTVRFDARPFAVMNDGAYLDLGVLEGALAKK